MPLESFVISFVLVFLTELGDKTMIATILLSAEHRRPYLVLFATMLALATSTAIAVIIGVILSATLPLDLVIFTSGILFIGIGLYTLMKNESDKNHDTPERRITFLSMFSLVLVSELGDKSQLAILVLAAQSSFPVIVFFGAVFGFLVLNTISALSGDRLGSKVPLKAIRLFTGIVFIAIGILLIGGFI